MSIGYQHNLHCTAVLYRQLSKPSAAGLMHLTTMPLGFGTKGPLPRRQFALSISLVCQLQLLGVIKQGYLERSGGHGFQQNRRRDAHDIN